MRKITEITIHCSATPPRVDIGALEIDKMHKDRGWHGIGYHFVIRRGCGSVEEGRPIEKAGAHVRGHNTNSVAICIIGGVDEHGRPDCNFTMRQWSSLQQEVVRLKNLYPNAVVKGHRDYPGVAKACPCFNVGAWWRDEIC